MPENLSIDGRAEADGANTKLLDGEETGGQFGPADVARIGFPLVVKPSSEGSSVGVSIVKDQSQLQAALDAAGKDWTELLAPQSIRRLSALPGASKWIAMPPLTGRMVRRVMECVCQN